MEEFLLEGADFIELNKLLKILRWVGSGGEANGLITEGEVLLNGIPELQKRKKLRSGDVVSLAHYQVKVK